MRRGVLSEVTTHTTAASAVEVTASGAAATGGGASLGGMGMGMAGRLLAQDEDSQVISPQDALTRRLRSVM